MVSLAKDGDTIKYSDAESPSPPSSPPSQEMDEEEAAKTKEKEKAKAKERLKQQQKKMQEEWEKKEAMAAKRQDEHVATASSAASAGEDEKEDPLAELDLDGALVALLEADPNMSVKAAVKALHKVKARPEWRKLKKAEVGSALMRARDVAGA